ncbi:hypothetical protein [Bradyrhizobium australiense]|uniref:Uncharacterized protein n=1 Tax=Bradyrhizobium australiense TaxID=2721161 RepID=A0A7Y4GWA9_9BRAD|nr:hypothetical protein [Bradyrhizobium australiense]NOJ42934.1 hypothetical protein [Bradyrhizobium australiense]
MPVARYFLFVGGVLLALLLAIDAFVPQQAVVATQAAPSVDKTVVRIRSDQKLPERVVYDTSLPTIVPPPAMTAQAVAPPVPAVAPASADAAQARARETYAQFVPGEARKPEPQVQRKRKVAKGRPAPPMQFAQPPQMRVAQQSHFGFFGGPSWNTW